MSVKGHKRTFSPSLDYLKSGVLERVAVVRAQAACLFNLEAEFFHQAAPLLFFPIDVGCVFGRCRREWIATLVMNLRLYLGRFDQLAHFFTESVDDLLRRTGRRQQTVMQHSLEAG